MDDTYNCNWLAWFKLQGIQGNPQLEVIFSARRYVIRLECTAILSCLVLRFYLSRCKMFFHIFLLLPSLQEKALTREISSKAMIELANLSTKFSLLARFLDLIWRGCHGDPLQSQWLIAKASLSSTPSDDKFICSRWISTIKMIAELNKVDLPQFVSRDLPGTLPLEIGPHVSQTKNSSKKFLPIEEFCISLWGAHCCCCCQYCC